MQHAKKRFNVCQEASRTISKDYLKKVQQSLPKRVQAILKNEGGHLRQWVRSWQLCSSCLYLLSPYIVFFFNHDHSITLTLIFFLSTLKHCKRVRGSVGTNKQYVIMLQYEDFSATAVPQTSDAVNSVQVEYQAVKS